MKVARVDYSGKRVFVGIDVHKNRYAIAAYCDGAVAKKWSAEADPEAVAAQLCRYFEGAQISSAYEAGFSGFRLHRILSAAGIASRVVNAASLEVKSNDRVKTDKRDAKKIAEQLAAGKPRAIDVPSEEVEQRRSLTRGREQAVERRKVIGNQLKMKLSYLGIDYSEQSKISETFLKWVEKLEVTGSHKFVLREFLDAWRQETKRIKRYEQELTKQAANDPLESIYRSAPGIGKISSRTLSNELGDMARFDNERQLFSSMGLTPGEYSSGERIRKGHISRQGSPRLRALLTEAAWRAIAEDQSLKIFYTRVARTRDSKRAIIAVARKLLGRLRHCLMHKVMWQDLTEPLLAS